MIKATGTFKGKPTLLIGLSGENMTRLMADEPIRFDMAEFGLPSITMLIVGGRTEDDITEQLRTAGLPEDRLWLHVGDLTEVKPALPPEPPNFSTVRVGKAAFVRNDGSGGANWYGPGGWLGWPALCETAMTDTGFPPVLLVPDPVAEAPDLKLPWRCELPGGDIYVGDYLNDSRVWVKVTDQHDESGAVPIAASVAREMGLALLKVAQQQKENT